MHLHSLFMTRVCNRYTTRSDCLIEGHYLALINRTGGLYGKILNEVVSTGRLSSVIKMFIQDVNNR